MKKSAGLFISIGLLVILISIAGFSSESSSVDSIPLAPSKYVLVVPKMGDGIVKSSSGALNCGDKCLESNRSGSIVELLATPELGWAFEGWSGDYEGAENPISIKIDSDKTIVASFIPAQYILTAKSVGKGKIFSTSQGIDCSGSCSEGFSSGSVAVITAIADLGWAFDSWGGGCRGRENPLKITMKNDETCSAKFVKGRLPESSCNQKCRAGL